MLSHFNKTTRDSSKAQNEYVMLKIVTAGALPLVKCPCCRKVPRNGVMLQCIEGHNVCEACRNTNPNPAICWKCGHRLNEPPTRNYTVENIIEAFPFEWPCNQADAGCNFTGERHALEVHEKTCNQHARFKCPHYNCNSTVLLGTVMEHFGTVHSNFTNFTKRYIGHGSKTGSAAFSWRNSHIESIEQERFWEEVPVSMLGPVASVLVCCQYTFNKEKKGYLHIWLWAPLGVEDAAKFECKITLSDYECFRGSIFSMLWDRNKVLQENHMRIPGVKMPIITKQDAHSNNREKVPFIVSFKIFAKQSK